MSLKTALIGTGITLATIWAMKNVAFLKPLDNFVFGTPTVTV